MAEARDEPQKNLPSTVLVIEDDEAVRSVLVEPLRLQGVERIDTSEDGEKAWQLAGAHTYDFIILDWKLPRVGGVALLNRFRSHAGYVRAPILVVSGYLNRADFTLLDEFPLTGRLQKPFKTQAYLTKIAALLKEAQWYQKQEDKVTKLLVSIGQAGPNDPGIGQVVLELARSAPEPLPIFVAAVRALRETQAYKTVELVAREGLKVAGDSALLLNELGKALLARQQFKEARRVLEKAQQISPQNLERLCSLGQASLAELEPGEARSYFQQALGIDRGSEAAASGVELAGNVETYLAEASPHRIPNSFAGLLNAIGIAMVRSGEFEQGVEHYKSALRYVPDEHAKAKLSFNLGLGYLRWQKPLEALPWFQAATRHEPSFAKAEKYASEISGRYGDPSLGIFEPDRSADPFALAGEAAVEAGYESDPDPIVPSAEPALDAPPAALAGGDVDDDSTEPEAGDGAARPEKPKTKFTANGATLERLAREAPAIAELAEMLAKMGAGVSEELAALERLLDEYGAREFEAAVEIAAKRKTPRAVDVATILAERNPKPARESA